MILFLFLILIILVTICIYNNYFSNQEGNTIFFKPIENNQYLTTDSETKEIEVNTFNETGNCGKLQNQIESQFNDILKYFKNSEKRPKLGKIKDSCNLGDYGKSGFINSSNISFEVNKTLLGTNENMVCPNNKKLKGNLYCNYVDDVKGGLEIIGDISCVDVSDFKDENWYKNVINYSFEYTNDGSKDKLHYICKSNTGINGVLGNNVGSITAINWTNKEEKKCKCPGEKFYYGGKCNEKTQHSTDEKNESGKNDRILSEHPLPECSGKWMQVKKCKKSSSNPTSNPTFEAKFIYEQGNGIPSGGRNDTTCAESTLPNGVYEKGVYEKGVYYKNFDCDTSCGEWVTDDSKVCSGNLNPFKYDYKNEIINKNECFFELPEIPGIENCKSGPTGEPGEYNKPVVPP